MVSHKPSMVLAAAGLTPVIQVFDMAKSPDFYSSKLGFEVVAASPEIDAPEGTFLHRMLLCSGAIDLMLNAAYDSGERPALPESARRLAHADTNFYVSWADVDVVHDELTQAGLKIDRPLRRRHMDLDGLVYTTRTTSRLFFRSCLRVVAPTANYNRH